jgi:hypothetical protein
LDRAELTSLERDRLIAKWVRLTEAENSESGEKVKKKARGRPEGGIAKAARQLPVKGETEEAKRKTVERALKSDRLLPGAEDAAKAAGFDKNRSLIIKIGAEKTLEAQLARIAELAGAQRNAKARAKAQRESGSGNKVTFDSLKTEWLEDKKLRRSAWEKTAKGDCVRFAKEVLRVSGEDEEGDH